MDKLTELDFHLKFNALGHNFFLMIINVFLKKKNWKAAIYNIIWGVLFFLNMTSISGSVRVML